jgi:feruloyl esterase
VKRWDALATTKVVNNQPDLESALPRSERQVIATAILARCDGLDGVADGLVQDVEACRTAFDLNRDVPTCTGARDGTCLTTAQKAAVAGAYAAVRTTTGEAVYSTFPFDPGLVQNGWADWKFRSSVGNTRNPVSMAYIFSTPPSADVAMAADRTRTAAFAVGFNLETEYPKIFATSGVYTESSMSFMTAPNPTQLDTLRDRGAKMVVVHGLSDGIFSPDDTQAWYQAVDSRYEGRADRFMRYFRVPGMGHSRGGPATDQYDALSALVKWVEQGEAPARIIASARGAGNAGGVNADVPADWSPTRTRPLCPFPLVARYKGGDKEMEASFACEK